MLIVLQAPIWTNEPTIKNPLRGGFFIRLKIIKISGCYSSFSASSCIMLT